jgi:hypothetical protein
MTQLDCRAAVPQACGSCPFTASVSAGGVEVLHDDLLCLVAYIQLMCRMFVTPNVVLVYEQVSLTCTT